MLPQVEYSISNDTSLDLRRMAELMPQGSATYLPPPIGVIEAPIIGTDPDPVVQAYSPSSSTLDAFASSPLGLLSWDGYNGYLIPDANVAVGSTQIVQAINYKIAVYTKTGATILAPVAFNTIFLGFGGACAGSASGGDPIVLYDKQADRWLMSGMASDPITLERWQCIAISVTSDATGAYYRYQFPFGVELNDFPKLGVWPDGYYANYNMFPADPAKCRYGKQCVYERSVMLQGGTARAVCFNDGNFGTQTCSADSRLSMLPSDLDGATQPPIGSPNFYLTLGSSTSLKLYKFHVDWNQTANSTLAGPINITVPSYSSCPASGSCNVPQPGTALQLMTLADRLQHRLAYRAFADHQALVVSHSVAVGSGRGVRWYEIRSPDGTPVVYQASTWAPNADFRWMSSIAMDGDGNIALGYSVSSGATYPGIRFTGRRVGDYPNTMRGEITIVEGASSVTTGDSPLRWGDYTCMAIDPANDQTFAYTNQYNAPVSTPPQLRTRIATFDSGSFGACDGGLTECSGACVSLYDSDDNCGSCGHRCASGSYCSDGVCCSGGATNCCGDGVCRYPALCLRVGC
jgi:hypothetical protein